MSCVLDFSHAAAKFIIGKFEVAFQFSQYVSYSRDNIYNDIYNEICKYRKGTKQAADCNMYFYP